jgi:hypothetical protein
MTTTREAIELLDASFGIVVPGQSLQVVSDKLIETLAEGSRPLTSSSHDLLIDR